MILIFQRYRDILLENIDYDVLIQNPQIDQEQLSVLSVCVAVEP